MRIAIGADHAGRKLKQAIGRHLIALGHDVLDVGTNDSQPADYPDPAREVGALVGSGDYERGVLICGSGIGMAMAANKIAGVRAAACYNNDQASLSRMHNDANVITLGERLNEQAAALEMVDVWLSTAFEGGRHQKRVDKLSALDREPRKS